MAKKVTFTGVLDVKAQQVTAGPPLATTLGPKGAALGKVAQEINEKTKNFSAGTLVRVRVWIHEDRSHALEVLGEKTSSALMQAAGIEKGASSTGTETAGSVELAKAQELAEKTFPKLSPEAALNTLKGTMRSMGLKVK